MAHDFANARGALAATALTPFVGGLGLLVVRTMSWLSRPEWWDGGPAGIWVRRPSVTSPCANLQWASHHHAAALLALV